MDKKYLAIMVICLIVLGGIGAYFAYGAYKEQKFASSYELQYQYAKSAAKIQENNDRLLFNTTEPENETSFKTYKETILKNLDQEILNEKKSLYYREQMVYYAPSELYKEYAVIMVKLMKTYIEYLEVTKEMVLITQYQEENTNLTKRAELQKKQAELVNATNELILERNKLVSDNPQLENFLKKLTSAVSNRTQSSSGMERYQNSTNKLFG